MRLKILLVASLLLSAALIGAAAYKAWNDGKVSWSRANGVDQSTGVERPPNSSQNETNASPINGVVTEEVFNETFKLSMILQNTTFSLGEPINITLQLTNVGNQNACIYFKPWPSWVPAIYRVLNQTGSVIYDPTWEEVPHIQIEVAKTLEPNETIQNTFTWHQVYYSNSQKHYVSTGTYYIVGLGGFYFDGGYAICELSPVEIQIV